MMESNSCRKFYKINFHADINMYMYMHKYNIRVYFAHVTCMSSITYLVYCTIILSLSLSLSLGFVEDRLHDLSLSLTLTSCTHRYMYLGYL